MHSLLLENFQFGQENKVDNSQRFPLYFFLKAAFSKEDFFMLYLITLALKKVMKTWDCEKPNKTRAKKVVIPPLMMAGPILFKLLTARSSLVPGKERKKILDNRVVEDSKAKDRYTIQDKNLDNTIKNTTDSIQKSFVNLFFKSTFMLRFFL